MTTREKLPDGWRSACLKDLLDSLETGKRPPGGVVGIIDGVPSLSAEHMDDLGGFKLETLRFVPREFYQQMIRGHICIDDILIVKDGATTGKTTFVDKSFPFKEAVVNEHVFICRPNTQLVDPKYLFFWLWGPDGQHAIRTSYRGAAIGGINRRFVDNMFLPLPPLAEQQRISSILTEKMAAIDQARAAAQAQLEAAQALPAAYLRAVFNSKEAQTWPQRRLGGILNQRREVVHPRDNPSGPATFVGLGHIESLVGVRTSAVDVEMSELTGRKPKFYKNDIVYGYLRPYLNKVWIAEFDGLCSVDQYIYSVDQALADTVFVAWFMRSSTYLKRAPIGLTPGQLPRIRTEEVAAVKINLPPLEDQKRIAQKVNEQMRASRQAVKALSSQLEMIDNLPAAYLRQAFNGEL